MAMTISAKPLTGNNVFSQNIVATKATTPSPVKIATSNLYITNNDIPEYATINDLVFQTLNPGEILDYGDNSIINGDGTIGTSSLSGNSISSSIARNILDISLQYNPQNLLSSTNYILQYQQSFPMKLEVYVPKVGTGPNGEIVYTDSNNNLIINTINLKESEEVEIEFWQYDVELNDTIVE